jgi:hypothetical protein
MTERSARRQEAVPVSRQPRKAEDETPHGRSRAAALAPAPGNVSRSPSAAPDFLGLQRQAGNRAVSRLINTRDGAARSRPARGESNPRPAPAPLQRTAPEDPLQYGAEGALVARTPGERTTAPPAGVQARTARVASARAVTPRPGARPGIQRAAEDFGLRTKTSTSAFVSEAVAFWKETANKDKPLKDYATFLMDKVNTMLPTTCPSTFVTSGGDSGTFSRVTWSITINTTKFSTNTDTDTVGELTADEAAEVADTIYHEARHSEQYFSFAQIMAGEGKDATAIAAAISIPATVAAEAVKVPIKANKKNKAMIEAVKDWGEIGAGIHSTYKGLVNGFIDAPDEVSRELAAVDDTKLAATVTKTGTTMASWKSGQLAGFQAELVRLDKITKKSKGDKLVTSHTKKIIKLLEGIISTWEKDKTRSAATLKALGKQVSKLYEAVYAAYRDHLHEKDAWATGGAAGKEFRTTAKKKK